jgi:hypothetical protein
MSKCESCELFIESARKIRMEKYVGTGKGSILEKDLYLSAF